jgi:hypothetical protein
MKVTDAMVERATHSLYRDFALETEDAARAALEAALADVPEPLDEPAIEALIDVQFERIAELEAKLETFESRLPVYKIHPDGSIECVEPPMWERERMALEGRVAHAEGLLGIFYQRVMHSTDYRDEMLELLKDYSKRAIERGH